MKWFAALIILFAAPCVQAFAQTSDDQKSVAYGSRIGMNVTVLSRQGINTRRAVILGKLTEQNAREFCVGYAQDKSSRCVAQYLRDTKLQPSIAADCSNGEFSTFYGERFRFEGKAPAGGDTPYVIRDLKTKTVLDGSSASGFDEDLAQFKALCPARLTDEVTETPAPSKDSTVCARTVETHGFLSRAQFQCGFRSYSNNMLEAAKQCASQLPEQVTNELLERGMHLFDDNEMERGHSAMCALMLKDFPNVLRR